MSRGDLAVRRYLRVAVEHPDLVTGRGAQESAPADDVLQTLDRIQAGLDRQRVEALEDAFVRVARSWCRRAGVTSRVLEEFGVPHRVLIRAGLSGGGPAASAVRRQYGRRARTVGDLADRAGVSVTTAWRTVREDLEMGVLVEVGNGSQGARKAPMFRLRRVDE